VSVRQGSITSRIIRGGEKPPPEVDEWSDFSCEERMEAVWTLTRLCLAWTSGDPDEPRLQRSVSYVRRSWR